MKILLADKQPEVRSALKLLLEQEAGLKVAYEAGNRKDLFQLIENMCPDAILLDWELAGNDGVKLLRDIKTSCPRLTILVFSSKPDFRQTALDAGANRFISKSSSPLEVISQVTSCLLQIDRY